MAAATDGGTAAAAAIITGGEGAVAITMAGAATVIGVSQPGPLESGPFYSWARQRRVSGPTLEFFLTFLTTASSQAGVFSADDWQAALPLSPGTPLPFEETVFVALGGCQAMRGTIQESVSSISDARNMNRVTR